VDIWHVLAAGGAGRGERPPRLRCRRRTTGRKPWGPEGAPLHRLETMIGRRPRQTQERREPEHDDPERASRDRSDATNRNDRHRAECRRQLKTARPASAPDALGTFHLSIQFVEQFAEIGDSSGERVPSRTSASTSGSRTVAERGRPRPRASNRAGVARPLGGRNVRARGDPRH
jgi:hypothetical protein